MNRRALLYQARTILRRRALDISRTNPDCPPYNFLDLVVFPVLGINCVIDVGASRGEFGGHLRDYGYTGRIVSFEPISENYRQLQVKAQSDEAWITYRQALGDQDGVVDMNVTRGSFWPSILTPSEYGKAEYSPDIDVTGSERVEIRRLDTVFDDCIRSVAEPRVYLKLDTQGYDRQVLDGAGGILPRIPALQTELSFRHEYEGMTPAADMIRFLEERGYALSGIFKVFRDHYLALSEADGIFVRPDAVA